MYNSPKQKGVILFYKHTTGGQMAGIIKGSLPCRGVARIMEKYRIKLETAVT
jgi:hypothetical protein